MFLNHQIFVIASAVKVFKMRVTKQLCHTEHKSNEVFHGTHHSKTAAEVFYCFDIGTISNL